MRLFPHVCLVPASQLVGKLGMVIRLEFRMYRYMVVFLISYFVVVSYLVIANE